MQDQAARPLNRPLVLAAALGVLAVILFSLAPLSLWLALWERLTVFATVFLAIFIEAVPYLLLGTLASGLVEVFVDRERLARLIPRGDVPAAFAGALLGMIFPVCECGTIPLGRRLIHKGMPLSSGVAFMLAAPVLNPIVIFSTASAFGWGPMLGWRLALTLAIAFVTAVIFSVEKKPDQVLRLTLPVLQAHERAAESRSQKLQRALVIGADEFFEMGRFLVLGALLAAAMQTFIPQAALLAVGRGPLLSVIVMLTLAFVLSICSTVDAFVALGFTGVFSFGSVLSFLVFGPMVDIKSILMYRQVFRPRAVAYLIALPLLMTLLGGLVINYFFL